MRQKLETIAVYVAIALFIVLGGTHLYDRLAQKPNQDDGITVGGVVSTAPIDLVGSSTTGAAINATSTKIVVLGANIDQLDLNIQSNATTSPTAGQVITWLVYTSNDESCATDAGTTAWFGEDRETVATGVVTHVATTTVHTWTPTSVPANGGPVRLATRLTDLNSKCVRLDFSAASTTDDNTIWVQAVGKQITR